MQRLLDPSFDPWAWLWQAVQAHANPAGISDAVAWLMDPAQRMNVTLGAILLIGLVMMRRGSSSRKTGATKPDVKLPSQGRPLLHGLFHGHERSVKVGGLNGVRFDAAWRHIGILGTSGARKSTLMAMLLERIGKTYVWVTGDHSPPLLNLTLSQGGLVWRPRGELAWYPWGGDLELAVQRVEHMFPASGADVGVHRSMFKQAARLAWAKVDERSRDVRQIMAALPEVVSGSSGKTMAENWNARLKELVDSLGDSLKSASDGGLDLVELLGEGIPMGFALDAFADVSNRERFAKIAMLETLRAADTLGNLAVGIDEVGLLGAELFAESVRTLRVRLCNGVFASHIAKDFPDILRGLITVWFLGQVPGGDKSTREWCSSTTFGVVPPEHFGDHVLPLGTFWLVAGGRVQKLTVPTWRTRREWSSGLNAGDAVSPVVTLPVTGRTLGNGSPGETAEDECSDEALFDEPPAPFRSDAQLLNIYGYVELKGSHRLSKYGTNNRGRPLCKYRGEQWLPYALLLATFEGRDLREVRRRMGDRSAQGLSVDHLCRELDPLCSVEDERRCQELSHLCWKTNAGNRRVQWDRARRRLQVVG